MAVPKFYEFMPSIIRCLGDGKVHSAKEITEYCADELHLSEKDKAEIISSGQSKLHNRVGWAKTYLKKAGLIKSTKRAHFCLTDEGAKAFQAGADCVTLEYLRSFDLINEFEGKTKENHKTISETEQIKTESPQEQIESALRAINDELAENLRNLKEIRCYFLLNFREIHELPQKNYIKLNL